MIEGYWEDSAPFYLPNNLTIMSKHTPGPWTAVQNAGYGKGMTKMEYLILQDKPHNAANIAKSIDCVGMSEEEIGANARLMAAAPSLLNLVKELISNQFDYERSNTINYAERLIKTLNLE